MLISELLLAMTLAASCDADGWRAAYQDYRTAHPAATVQDFYKLARQGNTDQLLAAFIATANAPRGDTAQFRCAESALGMLGVTGGRGYFAARRREGFPAVHHSPPYEAAYGPAYRVVNRALVPQRPGLRAPARPRILGGWERPPAGG